MSKKNNVHITKRPNGWAVKTENTTKAYKITKTQKEAIAIGKKIAEKRGSENIIHGRDGRIRDRDSYGNDPFPPKG